MRAGSSRRCARSSSRSPTTASSTRATTTRAGRRAPSVRSGGTTRARRRRERGGLRRLHGQPRAAPPEAAGRGRAGQPDRRAGCAGAAPPRRRPGVRSSRPMPGSRRSRPTGSPAIAPRWRCSTSARAPSSTGSSGTCPDAQLLPLDELRARMDEILGVQAGGRSSARPESARRWRRPSFARLASTRVANLAGGMVRWRQLGLPSGDAASPGR